MRLFAVLCQVYFERILGCHAGWLVSTPVRSLARRAAVPHSVALGASTQLDAALLAISAAWWCERLLRCAWIKHRCQLRFVGPALARKTSIANECTFVKHLGIRVSAGGDD
jgi:hypothetical protein